MFTICYMKCGRKWRVVAHEGIVNGGFYCRPNGDPLLFVLPVFVV